MENTLLENTGLEAKPYLKLLLLLNPNITGDRWILLQTLKLNPFLEANKINIVFQAIEPLMARRYTLNLNSQISKPYTRDERLIKTYEYLFLVCVSDFVGVLQMVTKLN